KLVETAGRGSCAQPTGACGQVAGLYHDRTTFTNLAGWSFIGAGVLGTATVIYAMTVKSNPKARVRAGPMVTASGGAFLVGGAWKASRTITIEIKEMPMYCTSGIVGLSLLTSISTVHALGCFASDDLGHADCELYSHPGCEASSGGGTPAACVPSENK